MLDEPVKHILLVEDQSKDVELTLAALAMRHLANAVAVTRDGVEAVKQAGIVWALLNEPPPASR